MAYSSFFKISKSKILFCCLFIFSASNQVYSQAEVEAWGNFKGIRVDGELIRIESSLDVVKTAWSGIAATAKERQRPKYKRDGDMKMVTTRIDSFYFVQQVEDIGKGIVKVNVQLNAKKDTSIRGIFFHLKLPLLYYNNGVLRIGSMVKGRSVNYQFKEQVNDLVLNADTISFTCPQRQLGIRFKESTKIVIRHNERNLSYVDVFIALQENIIKNGDVTQKTFTLTTSGAVDKAPIKVQLNTSVEGPRFAGFGGNFRLQNPKTDPLVIDYCLANMRVAWGRVEMPWQLWQPEKDSSPIDAAKAGRLNDHVKKSMEMAARLYKKGMPVVLTAWSAPAWAVTGKISYGPRADGVWGNPLDTTATTRIYQSIADYITYLKDTFGVETALFSFNESDLGINIRQTGEEHAKLIKGLGSYFVSRGLKTKMLLGDNSDATTYAFIYPAMNDAATHPFIGAISFHSWRGCDTATLQKWRNAADELKLPLLVGEGSIDAAAWNYPLIFEEPVYSMEEIELYIRLLAICKPVSILQWQLTADYSPLAGGGIFGNNEPLRPTQRFWNLKQLASIPENLNAIPVTVTGIAVTAAAEGNAARGQYAIHLVNNGAARTVNLQGLPKNVKQLHLFVTNKTKHNEESTMVKVTNGKAAFLITEVSYTTLISE